MTGRPKADGSASRSRGGTRAYAGSSRRRRRFGHIRKLPSGRFQAIYTDNCGVRQRADHTFLTKGEAEQFLAVAEADLLRGDWIDPSRRRRSFSQWAADWLSTTAHLAPKTIESYESALRNHLIPAFGQMAVGAIDAMAVRRFISSLQLKRLSPKTIANIKNLLSAVLTVAVDCGAMRSNPCRTVKVPRGEPTKTVFLEIVNLRWPHRAHESWPHPTLTRASSSGLASWSCAAGRTPCRSR